MSNWIMTYTGKRFYYLNVTAASIDIKDIAHSLSLMCRFCGHSKEFYSVSEHSARVSQLVSQENKLAALLHDAAEAYLGDLSRPLKVSLPEISIIEQDIKDIIFNKFNIGIYDETAVKRADDIMLATEARDLMMNWPDWKLKEKPLDDTIIPVSSIVAEKKFLFYFSEYSKL